MSKGFRLRAVFSVLAVATASLAVAATAGASSGGGVTIQSRDACDPATFPPDVCNRTDNSGGVVSFGELATVLPQKLSHPAWKFTKDQVTVKRGTPVIAEFGRGGEIHTFTDVTATGPGPGCIPDINVLLGFDPDEIGPACVELGGLGGVIGRDGLFPGVPKTIDTSTPGTRIFECMLHPWMQTVVTVQ
jgi:hypothetical protein